MLGWTASGHFTHEPKKDYIHTEPQTDHIHTEPKRDHIHTEHNMDRIHTQARTMRWEKTIWTAPAFFSKIDRKRLQTTSESVQNKLQKALAEGQKGKKSQMERQEGAKSGLDQFPPLFFPK